MLLPQCYAVVTIHSWRTMLAPLALLLFLGCGPQTPPPSDLQAATELIQRTMDAWKAGATVADLRAKSPPVYVAEDLWLNGLVLEDYEVLGQGQIVGTNIRFSMRLHCADERGRASEHDVKYLVTTTPALTIAREDR